MQQSKAYVIKNQTRNLKASIAARKAEYVAYRYGTAPERKVSLASLPRLGK
jgi:hypothetical protein